MNRIAFYASLALVAAIPGLCFSLDDGLLGSVNRLIGILCFGIWFGSVIVIGRFRRLTWFHLLLAAYSVWYAISLWWSVDPATTLFRLTLLQSLVLVAMLWDIYRTRDRFDSALQALVIGSWVSVFSTIGQFIHGQQAREWEKRFSGSGFDPNDLALLLGIVVPIAMLLAVSKRNYHPVLRFLNFMYPFGALTVIVLTGSRGGLLAVIPAVLFCIGCLRYAPVSWRRLMACMAVVVLIVAGRVDLSDQVDRLTTAASSSSNDHFSGRADVWRGGWQAYCEHPLLGVGGGAFPTAAFKYSGEYEEPKLVAHNTFLSVIVELGPVGAIIFGMIIVVVVRSVLHLRGVERYAWLATLLVWGIGVSALSWDFRSQTWLTFILAYIAGTLPHVEYEPAVESAQPASRRFVFLSPARRPVT